MKKHFNFEKKRPTTNVKLGRLPREKPNGWRTKVVSTYTILKTQAAFVKTQAANVKTQAAFVETQVAF